MKSSSTYSHSSFEEKPHSFLPHLLHLRTSNPYSCHISSFRHKINSSRTFPNKRRITILDVISVLFLAENINEFSLKRIFTFRDAVVLFMSLPKGIDKLTVICSFQNYISLFRSQSS